MTKTLRLFILPAVLSGLVLSSFADRAIPKKKNKAVLNIKAPVSFQSALNFNLRTGLRYTGSIGSSAVSSPSSFTTVVTYTKGNSVYVLPYKQRVLVADAGRGYAGTKLIIRPR